MLAARSCRLGLGSRALGAGPWEQGLGSRALGAGPWEQGLGSRALGAGPWEQGLGSRALGAGPWEQGLGSIRRTSRATWSSVTGTASTIRSLRLRALPVLAAGACSMRKLA